MKTPNIFAENKQILSDSEKAFFQNQTSNENSISAFDLFMEEIININGAKCPHCGSEKVVKNGKMKNKTPRFLCNSCKKSYSLYSGTFLQYLKLKKKLFDYIPLRMEQSGSLRNCSQTLKISLNTSFEWNKKLFGSMQKIIPNKLDGIVEITIFHKKISRKGEKPKGFFGFKPPDPITSLQKKYKKAPKLKEPPEIAPKVQIAVTFSRIGKLDMKVLQLGDLNKSEIKKHLYPKIKSAKKILINEDPILKLTLQGKRMCYLACKEDQKVKSRNKYYDVETVKAVTYLFSTWMKRFRGVATKYLQNYIKWFLHKLKYRNYELNEYHLAMDSLQNKKGKNGYQESVMFI